MPLKLSPEDAVLLLLTTTKAILQNTTVLIVAASFIIGMLYLKIVCRNTDYIVKIQIAKAIITVFGSPEVLSW